MRGIWKKIVNVGGGGAPFPSFPGTCDKISSKFNLDNSINVNEVLKKRMRQNETMPDTDHSSAVTD